MAAAQMKAILLIQDLDPTTKTDPWPSVEANGKVYVFDGSEVEDLEEWYICRSWWGWFDDLYIISDKACALDVPNAEKTDQSEELGKRADDHTTQCCSVGVCSNIV